jgi:peptide/nickel transport system ATP-binding protein
MTPLTRAEPVASIRDLCVSFQTSDGRVDALRGVNLDLLPGEVLALVGESGSGKSVLGSMLLGLTPESRRTTVSGSVMTAGVDMLGDAASRRRTVRRHLLGAVFQDPLTSLDPTMRVGKQLTERPISLNRALANLRDAGVPEPGERISQWPHELSGGLRQRVMLAMALGADGRLPDDAGAEVLDEHGSPLLIVADEPTTALDVSVQAQILLHFDRLRRDRGCALLLVTHDLGVAASVADRIAVLYAGRLCEVGPAAEVLTSPRHPYTAKLLHARLELDGDALSAAIDGSPPDPIRLPPGCAFAPRCHLASTECEQSLPVLEEETSGRWVACVNPLRLGDTGVGPVGATDRPRGFASRRDDAGPALVLRDVAKSFRAPGSSRDRLHAVSGVDLEVPRGGAVALVGESGCGKTTLLRIACGLTKPDHGSVTWADGIRPQLIFQDAGSSLTPWLRIETQVAERMHGAGDRNARRFAALELLERVGLDERTARSRPRQLSGGQRQRAAIARALATSPQLLVCDEPVSALDASLSVRILELLAALRADLGVAILLVTHDLAAARHVADDILIMYLGRVVEIAPAGVAFSDPRHPYTKGLRAASPTREPGRLAPTLEGEPPSPVGELSGCAFAGRCPDVEAGCRVQRQELRPLEGQPPRLVACQVACRDSAG